MAETTIEWTSYRRSDGRVVHGYTLNPWEGCEKISPACANCYAAARDARFHDGAHWGPSSTRLFHGESYWKQPLKWNREAGAAGERRRVFCASLADVFEEREDLLKTRLRLFDVIRTTPHLDWLLLTKRPHAILPILQTALETCAQCQPERADEKCGYVHRWLQDWLAGDPPANVWLGATVENQEWADRRIPELLRVPARVRFLSCEPLLGPIDLLEVFPALGCSTFKDGDEADGAGLADIHWVIVGGESGANARPMHPDYARSLRDQCEALGVPFFFKQWGIYVPPDQLPEETWRRLEVSDIAATEREFVRLGKKVAGRLLDGREWNGSPTVKEGNQ